jgi:cytochrome c556
MRTFYVVTLVVVLAAVAALAQVDPAYQGWMKSNAANMGSLNKNIAAKDGAAAAADAMKLQDTFKQVGDFWKKKGDAPDAVDFAMKAEMAAGAAAKAAQAGNMDEAQTQAKSLQGNCGGCHMAHRAGAQGNFSFK